MRCRTAREFGKLWKMQSIRTTMVLRPQARTELLGGKVLLTGGHHGGGYTGPHSGAKGQGLGLDRCTIQQLAHIPGEIR
jgi:hypothetical protein